MYIDMCKDLSLSVEIDIQFYIYTSIYADEVLSSVTGYGTLLKREYKKLNCQNIKLFPFQYYMCTRNIYSNNVHGT